MARLLCPKCNSTFSAASGTQPVCPTCGYTTSAGVVGSGTAQAPAAPQAPQPTYGYPGQPAIPAPGYAYTSGGAPQPPADARPVIPPDQQRTAPLAIAALICSLLPFGMYFLLPLAASEDTFFVFGPIGLIAAILGIVFGSIALGQIKKDPYLKGRGLALTGLIIGIVQLAITIVMILVVAIAVAALAAACSSCSAPAGFVHLAHAAPSMSRRQRVRDFLLAHHPDCGLYESDVFRFGSLRLCVGCVTAGAVGSAVLAALWFFGPALEGWQWIALGIAVGSAQFLSIAGWTSTRARKVAVKVFLGIGAAAAGYGLWAAPWPEMMRLGLLLLGGAFAVAFMVPRGLRMMKTCEGHAAAESAS